jgi:hypothetical protein
MLLLNGAARRADALNIDMPKARVQSIGEGLTARRTFGELSMRVGAGALASKINRSRP